MPPGDLCAVSDRPSRGSSAATQVPPRPRARSFGLTGLEQAQGWSTLRQPRDQAPKGSTGSNARGRFTAPSWGWWPCILETDIEPSPKGAPQPASNPP